MKEKTTKQIDLRALYKSMDEDSAARSLQSFKTARRKTQPLENIVKKARKKKWA